MNIEETSIVLPVAYFPPISYYFHLIRAHKAEIEIRETFPRQTYRNRCRILAANGVLPLIVPVSKPDGNHTLTKDVLLSYRENWPVKHWRSLETAYSSAPFFLFFRDRIARLFEERYNLLTEWNVRVFEEINLILGVDAGIRFTEYYEKEITGTIDLRTSLSPKRSQSLLFPEYPQVFSYKFGFQPDLSILDLLFNLGPDSTKYLETISETGQPSGYAIRT